MSKWRLVPTEPSFTTLQRMHEAMFTDKWDGTQAVMIGAAYDAALEGAHPNATADLISQARAEGRREGLEEGAAAAKDLAQQWDDGEGSRTFNACMAIRDKLLEMAKEGKDGSHS